MKLPEKILYSRKQAGLSQEALADQIGVSRQAISKWETGDAVPEINKLLLLAKTFGVTTDWLLSETDEALDRRPEPSHSNTMNAAIHSDWIDSLPRMLRTMIRRYGWLVGVYITVVGAGFTALGTLSKYMVKRMFGSMWTDSMGAGMENPFSSIIQNNPVSIMGSFIQVLGLVMVIAGIILAVVLKKRSKEASA